MYLVTFTFAKERRLGCKIDDTIVDLRAAYDLQSPCQGSIRASSDVMASDSCLGDMMAFLRGGERALEVAQVALDFAKQLASDEQIVDESGHRVHFRINQVRIEAPIPRPRRIIGVEMNYRRNLEEVREYLISHLGVDVPEWPVLDHPWTFPKFPSCVIGPGGSIVYPEFTNQLDGEVELAVVIGKKGKHISSQEAKEYIAGYTIMNDVSARDVEFTLAPDINHRLFTLAKNVDTFAPMGPCLVTTDEVREPDDLAMEMRFNGTVIQASNTKYALKNVYELIAFYSELFVLEAGDIVMTGGPGHSGAYHEPPIFLRPGDTVTVAIEGLGTLTNPVVAST